MQNMKKSLIGWIARPLGGFFAGAIVVTITGAAAAQQPAQRAAPAQRAQPAPAAAAPTIDAPQRTTATYDDWVVQCETRPGPPVEKFCDMAQVTQVQGRNAPFSRIAIARPVKGQPIKLVLQVPVNASFASDVRVQTGDSDTGLAVPFARCVPAGCFAEFDIKDDVLKKFRTASGVGKVSFADSTGHDVAVPLSFKGFPQAYDALGKE
jgi:invasion protein IalB